MPVYSAEQVAHLHGHLDNERPGEAELLLEFARTSRGPILELACGAARLMRVFARRGYTVYGIEASPEMLQLAEDTTCNFDQSVRARMHWARGDMRVFDTSQVPGFPTVFGMIIVPFHSFWLNLDRDGAEQCVQSMVRHLRADGVILVDTPLCPEADRHTGGDALGWWQRTFQARRMECSIIDYKVYDPVDADFPGQMLVAKCI